MGRRVIFGGGPTSNLFGRSRARIGSLMGGYPQPVTVAGTTVPQEQQAPAQQQSGLATALDGVSNINTLGKATDALGFTGQGATPMTNPLNAARSLYANATGAALTPSMLSGAGSGAINSIFGTTTASGFTPASVGALGSVKGPSAAALSSGAPSGAASLAIPAAGLAAMGALIMSGKAKTKASKAAKSANVRALYDAIGPNGGPVDLPGAGRQTLLPFNPGGSGFIDTAEGGQVQVQRDGTWLYVSPQQIAQRAQMKSTAGDMSQAVGTNRGIGERSMGARIGSDGGR